MPGVVGCSWGLCGTRRTAINSPLERRDRAATTAALLNRRLAEAEGSRPPDGVIVLARSKLSGGIVGTVETAGFILIVLGFVSVTIGLGGLEFVFLGLGVLVLFPAMFVLRTRRKRCAAVPTLNAVILIPEGLIDRPYGGARFVPWSGIRALTRRRMKFGGGQPVVLETIDYEAADGWRQAVSCSPVRPDLVLPPREDSLLALVARHAGQHGGKIPAIQETMTGGKP